MLEKPTLMIIGNSNTGKSSITRLLLPNPKLFKGKSGKTPGSTLLIRPISQPGLKYQIVDLPGFGYMKSSSKRREEHIKNQIVSHVEHHHEKYFLALIIINILRIEDELTKYFTRNQTTIPLSFELIDFLSEFKMPKIIILNKIDKVSTLDKTRIISVFLKKAEENGYKLIPLEKYILKDPESIPYLEFSALKKLNLGTLKTSIEKFWGLNER